MHELDVWFARDSGFDDARIIALMGERRSIVVTYRQGFKYWLYGILLLVTVASLMAGMFWERSKVSEILAEKPAC